MWGPIIGAGIQGATSLLGGFLGQSSARSAERRAMVNQRILQGEAYQLAEHYRIKPKQVVAEALEAGFNPLTVLSAGGLSGFQNPSVPSAPAMAGPNIMAEALMQAGSALGQGVSRAVDGMFPDPIAERREELETELLSLQVAAAQRAMNAPVAAAHGIGEVPRQRRMTRSPERLRRSPPLGREGDRTDVSYSGYRSVDPNQPITPVADPWWSPRFTGAAPMMRSPQDPAPFVPVGSRPYTATLGPNSFNLQSIEENYGEILTEAAGMWNAIDSLSYRAGQFIADTVRENNLSPRVQRYRARQLAAYWRGEINRPYWYKGPATPPEAPFE